ncbi:MAG: response regulator, partial [Candidatus Binatia bacterium]
MENKTVLVAEDNAPTRELINLVLIKFGYTVIVATTGIEALKKARAKLPNLIIMDLGLPGITGDEAVLCLKTDPITKHIPVIVNTAYHEGSVHVERAIIAGAAEILYKPNDFQALPNIVNQ